MNGRTVQPDAGERLDAELIGVLYDGRSNGEAVARCGAFAARYPSSPLLPDVKLTEFRLAVRMGDTATARTLGLNLWEGRVRGATAQQRFNAGELLAAYLVAVGDVEGRPRPVSRAVPKRHQCRRPAYDALEGRGGGAPGRTERTRADEPARPEPAPPDRRPSAGRPLLAGDRRNTCWSKQRGRASVPRPGPDPALSLLRAAGAGAARRVARRRRRPRTAAPPVSRAVARTSDAGPRRVQGGDGAGPRRARDRRRLVSSPAARAPAPRPRAGLCSPRAPRPRRATSAW